MDMGTMSMATSATSMTMAMASSTASSMSMSSSSSDMSSSSMSMSMTMADMAMTFFTSGRTPLYATSWTPMNDGQYAGTCIFLIVLSVILRLLLAMKPVLEARVWADNPHQNQVLQHHAHIEEQAVLAKNGAGVGLLTQVRRDMGNRWSGWRVNSAAGRATYELLIAGVAYLLMLAVMTMNVGYFLSVLAGIWLGTFILGGLAADNQWSHC